MASLFIILLTVTLTLFLLAWVLAVSARLAGSPRGKLRYGAVALLVLIVAEGCIAAVASWTVRGRIAGVWVFSIQSFIQICVLFIVLRIVFRLPVVRMLLPFCAYVGFIFAEYGIMILVVRPLIVDEFRFASRSMLPTLEPGDDFAVNRLLRPRRWDLVAYSSKDAEPEVHCHRLVGLPGERLRFVDGALYVNDELVKAPQVVSGRYHASSAEIPPSLARYSDGEDILLGPDEYFFVGDNVELAKDSRFTGPSPRSSIVGVADLIYWPVKHFRILR